MLIRPRSVPAQPGLRLFRVLWALALSFPLIVSGAAQQPRAFAVEGYITGVHMPSGFEVNGEHVALMPDTSFAMAGAKTANSDSPLRGEIQMGAYVQVVGDYNDRHKTAAAQTVFFRDDLDQRLEGIGVIDRVVSAGPEPIFETDGYRIRITSATETAFHGDHKSLADVGTDTWLRYGGKRGKDGVLVAEKAAFMQVRLKKNKARQGKNETNMNFEPPTFPPGSAAQDGKVKLGITDFLRKVPADAALQERIDRVGQRVVPAYQKALSEDDASKLNFRFYAVDAPRNDALICSSGGLILIPTHMVERLKNDDQLAAVLADGVARLLQRLQLDLATSLAAGAFVADMSLFTGPIGLVGAVGVLEERHKEEVLLDEQRARIALSLVDDAGYDPWQAPEAWRLLASKHLPKDLDSLKYPTLSGYQLGILHLQYNTGPAKPETSPAVAAVQPH